MPQKAKPLPPVDMLRECFEYADGFLIKKHVDSALFSSRRAWLMYETRDAGKKAGYASGNGRLYTRFMGVTYQVHRLVWAIIHGADPGDMCIDHIDGDFTNNRVENLRLSTHSQNLMNRPHTKKNKCGLKGVVLHRARVGVRVDPWTAKIKLGRKDFHLGCFRTKGEAAVAYAKASLRYHGKFSPFAERLQSAR